MLMQKHILMVRFCSTQSDYHLAGRYLTMLPVEPKLGKMLVLGAILNCLDPVLTVVAGLSVRDPFLMPLDKKDVSHLPNLILLDESHILYVLWLGWKQKILYLWLGLLSASMGCTWLHYAFFNNSYEYDHANFLFPLVAFVEIVVRLRYYQLACKY